MPVVINLMPPPGFDKSIVPAFQTNFNRIRDAFLRTSSRTHIEALEINAPFPAGKTISHPFKADVLAVWTASCWALQVGAGGLGVFLDNVIQNGWAQFYFNQTGVHTLLSASVVIRGVPAGSHYWSVTGTGAGVQLTSDTSDWAHVALTMLEVP